MRTAAARPLPIEPTTQRRPRPRVAIEVVSCRAARVDAREEPGPEPLLRAALDGLDADDRARRIALAAAERAQRAAHRSAVERAAAARVSALRVTEVYAPLSCVHDARRE